MTNTQNKTQADAENPKTVDDFRAHYRHEKGIYAKVVDNAKGVTDQEKVVYRDFCDQVLAPFDALLRNYVANRSDVKAGVVLAATDFVISAMLVQAVRLSTDDPLKYGDSMARHLKGIKDVTMSLLISHAEEDMAALGMTREDKIKGALAKLLGIDPALIKELRI